MSVFPPFVQRGLPGCLLAVLLWGAVQAGPARAAGEPALVLESCAAFSREPGLGEGWPGSKAVRPGQTVLPGDKGLGCRFTLAGAIPGNGVVVEARLTRPLAGGGQAVDRWFVPVRRGETAGATYAFAPGQLVPAGEWTLTLAAGGWVPAEARFQVSGTQPATGAVQGRPAAATALPPVPSLPASPPAADGEAPGPVPAASPASAKALAPAPAPALAQVTGPPSEPLPAPATGPAPDLSLQPQAGPSGGTVALPAPPARPASPDQPPPLAPRPPSLPAKAGEKKAQALDAAKPAAATGYIALQTGLFADADNAAAQAARLRGQGMPACLAVSGEGAKRRYRVLAGRFGDRRAAAEAKSGVAAILGLSPLLYTVEAGEVSRLRCR